MNKGRGIGEVLQRKVKPLPWPLMIIFLFLTAAITVSGFFYYQKQKKNALLEQTGQLQAIADLKAVEIENWLKERLGDARIIAENRILVIELLAFLHERSAGPRRKMIRDWMGSLHNTYHYQNILLLGNSGEIILALNGQSPFISDNGLDLLEAVRRRKNVALSDLHRSAEVPFPHLDLATPLLSENKIAGFIILRIDPAQFLYPMIQSWPTPSPSAETLLVRREGDDVLYLNELRHRKGTAMNLRFPIHSTELPAAQAALGKTGAFSGRDYRNVAVRSVTRPIANTSWFLVAKVDRDEIEHPIRRSALTIFIFSLSLVLAAALLILFLWQRQNSRFLLHQLEADSQKQALVQHFDYLSRYANDIILLAGNEGNILEANERAMVTYGYGREKLLKMNLSDLRVPEERDKLAAEYKQTEKKLGSIFETRHRKKDGSVFPVEVSARVIVADNKKYFQSIVRDISERKRVEIDLQNLSSRNQAMLEAIPDIIMEVDTNKVYTWANHAGIEFFGADVIGREAVFYFEGEQQTYLAVKPIFNGQEDVIYVESWQRRQDNEKRLLAWWCRVLKDENGNVAGALSSARDITELKRAEDALRESERKFRETIVTLDEGYYGVTLDGILLEHNQAFNRILGFDISKDLKGTHMPDFWQDPEDRLEYIRILVTTGAISNYQINAKTQQGEKITVLASAHLVKGENKQPRWIEGAFMDISQRIRAEQEIHRLNEELEQRVRERTAELSDLYNNAPCGYHSLDGAGTFVHINDTELKWLGYIREEIIGKIKFSDLLTPESIESFQNNFPVFKQRGWISNLEFEMKRKDGSILPVLLSASAINDLEGHYLMSRSTIIDNSEQKRAQNIQRESQTKIIAANKELEAFSYSVSHDLRAPLRAIDGFSRIVLEEYSKKLDKEGQRLLNVITANIGKMGRLIDDLLAFSRLSRQQMASAPVNLATMAKVVFAELKNLEKGRRIEFKVGALPVARGDYSMLQLVLQNLLANAVKFTRTRKPARIELGGKVGEGEIIFYVKDNGVGFDMKYVDKLFGVFQRLHGADEFEGTGVGLAIVQRIIVRHGGRVWAESGKGGGATFYFALPDGSGPEGKIPPVEKALK